MVAGDGSGSDIRYSIGGIYTGTAADYANRSRQGGVDDGPSLKKIGTGEGAQVYGWGLYGSTVRGVAEKYAMPTGLEIRRHGNVVKPWNDKIAGLIRDNFSSRNPIESALKVAKENGWDQKDIESLENGDYEVVASHSNVYEQTFFTNRAPGDESHLLKWYDAISDANWDRVIAQAEKEGLREKLKGAWWLRFNGDLEHFITDNGNSGDAIYESLSRLLGSPQAASEFLYRAGIDGVKYPVDSYGGKGVKDGDVAGWNYVAFSDEHIRVDHKWTDGQLRFRRALAPLRRAGKGDIMEKVPADPSEKDLEQARKDLADGRITSGRYDAEDIRRYLSRGGRNAELVVEAAIAAERLGGGGEEGYEVQQRAVGRVLAKSALGWKEGVQRALTERFGEPLRDTYSGDLIGGKDVRAVWHVGDSAYKLVRMWGGDDGGFANDLAKLIMLNARFGERYAGEVVGGGTVDGRPCLVVKQPWMERGTTDRETVRSAIERLLRETGLERAPDEDGYVNEDSLSPSLQDGRYIYRDLNLNQNYFVDEGGNVHIIDADIELRPRSEGNGDLRLSRGGYKPGDWRKTFTFGKAARGAAEQTNGGLAAGEERRRWEENPVDERIPEWDAPQR